MKQLLIPTLAVIGSLSLFGAEALTAQNPEVIMILPDGSSGDLAAQTSSVIILAKAGVLSGKKYAYVAEWAGEESIVDGAEYGGSGIVQDGKIITPLRGKSTWTSGWYYGASRGLDNRASRSRLTVTRTS